MGAVGTFIKLVACIGGTAFLGYCIYFDYKRRSEPNYREKVRLRRRANKNKKVVSQGLATVFPNPNNHEAIQRFFLQELQDGEKYLGIGDLDTGVEHLANALVVCGIPQHLMMVFQQTLPANVFESLVQKLPAVSRRYAAQTGIQF